MNADGDGPSHVTIFPKIARKKRSFKAHYALYDIVIDPAKAVLVNVLSCFHEKVAPIKKVEFATT